MFGAGSVCFDPANAIRMAALLDVLARLYLDREACDPMPVPFPKDTL